MNQDDIIRKFLDLHPDTPIDGQEYAIPLRVISRMLEAGAAVERERMAINSIHSCHSECQRPICVLVREAVAAEREECLRACKAYRYNDGDGQHVDWYAGIDGCIEAIRARNQA